MGILNTSVSGMTADSNWLSSISQNVANSNTTGYKDVETQFTALVDEIAGSAQPGQGVVTSLMSLNSVQGSVVSTQTSTDLAVQGSGFFIVSDSTGATFLTRNGSFVPDASGNLVNSDGNYLMGYDAQNGGQVTNSLTGLQKVNVTNAQLAATPTTSGKLVANLPSTASVVSGTLPSANSASSTYTDETSMVAYDSLGGTHTLDVYLSKTGSNAWEIDVYDHSAAASGGGFPYSSGPLATTTLSFNGTTGSLTSGSPLSIAVPGGATMSLDLSGMTQLASAFSVTSASANGNASATLASTSFGANGQLTFAYSNGTTQPGYDIPLGSVASPDNLTTLSNGRLLAQAKSGAISVGLPGTGGLGQLVPSSLESSTVDLATELTDMIQAQSSYEANSKAFQTGTNIFDVLNHLTP